MTRILLILFMFAGDPTRLPPDPIPEVVFTPGAWSLATPVPTLPPPVGSGELLPVTGAASPMTCIWLILAIIIAAPLVWQIIRFVAVLRWRKAGRRARGE